MVSAKEGVFYLFYWRVRNNITSTNPTQSSPEYEISKPNAPNLVALHTHQKWPGDEEYVTMDFFRFDENGKIVEHWDSMQQIPKESANGNTMY